jgi:hypothetical protein
MPPFVLPERIVTLVFDKGPLLGLELEVRLGVPFDFYFELTDLATKSTEEAGMDSLRTLLRRFAEIALVGWNLEAHGEPVPCTPDAFTANVDPINGGLMLRRYMAAIGGVPGPLAGQSANGHTSKVRKASPSRLPLSPR